MKGMLVRIDPSSDAPIYRQIADSISKAIVAGDIENGAKLPSARSLAESLGINMHTVLKSYSELESAGLVEMRRGRGGVVVKAAGDIDDLVGRLVSAAKRGQIGKTELVRRMEAAW